jgi:hypothetical protein
MGNNGRGDLPATSMMLAELSAHQAVESNHQPIGDHGESGERRALGGKPHMRAGAVG